MNRFSSSSSAPLARYSLHSIRPFFQLLFFFSSSSFKGRISPSPSQCFKRAFPLSCFLRNVKRRLRKIHSAGDLKNPLQSPHHPPHPDAPPGQSHLPAIAATSIARQGSKGREASVTDDVSAVPQRTERGLCHIIFLASLLLSHSSSLVILLLGVSHMQITTNRQ